MIEHVWPEHWSQDQKDAATKDVGRRIWNNIKSAEERYDIYKEERINAQMQKNEKLK